MGGGTEAFPELGEHCQESSCNQLDFLPFKCDGCQQVFCLEHRSYRSHKCPKAEYKNRRVVVCPLCSISIEREGDIAEDDEKDILERHEQSGSCDPSTKRKLKCPVKRCKQVLTFSNTNTCKFCNVKVCLMHRFPVDHACHIVSQNGTSKFLHALAARTAKECGGEKKHMASLPPSVKAC